MAFSQTTDRLVNICRSSSLTLAGCLIFLVPFDTNRNIDMQGLLLLVSGCFAWGALALGHREIIQSLDRLTQILLVIFVLFCLLSFLINPHAGHDFFGAPYIRLGAGSLLACIGIGLLAKTITTRRLLTGLYMLIVCLALVSLPYSWLHAHSLVRIGGPFEQADIFACFLGCGILLGLRMLSLYPDKRRSIVSAQLLLLVALLLTQTRVVIALIIALWSFWIFQHKPRTQAVKQISIGVTIALLLLVSLHHISPNRLTNAHYASQSLHYRLTLQRYALQASQQKPLWGYGPGNLADALSCSRLKAQPLQETCNEGYFFNSSHNIFIDRVLAIGWLGGVAFLWLVILAIYRGLRSKTDYQVMSYVLVLIGGYYLTNVTSVALELLLWILVLQCVAAPVKRTKQASRV